LLLKPYRTSRSSIFRVQGALQVSGWRQPKEENYRIVYFKHWIIRIEFADSDGFLLITYSILYCPYQIHLVFSEKLDMFSLFINIRTCLDRLELNHSCSSLAQSFQTNPVAEGFLKKMAGATA
jgi:hypothetical protein